MKQVFKKYLLPILLTLIVMAGVGFFGIRWLLSSNEGVVADVATEVEPEPELPPEPDFIDLQPIVDQWLGKYRHGEAAVEVYDLDNATIAATYRADASMYPLSIYKLFYTYDGYAQIDAGLDDPDAIYLGNYTLGECLDMMIRQSHNPCAETMLAETARETRVGQLVQELGLLNTKSDGLKTSAHDVSLLLQHYYAHPDWSEESWAKYLDSALNQPPTAAGDFRQGLPNGFSIATVYDKVGWQAGGTSGTGWAFYNDAAIVDFPENSIAIATANAAAEAVTPAEDATEASVPANSVADNATEDSAISSETSITGTSSEAETLDPNLKSPARHYIVVVMTRDTSHLTLVALGEMLESAILAHDRGEDAIEVDDTLEANAAEEGTTQTETTASE